MSQNATPLRLEDVAELERYLISKHKRSRIESVFDISLSILYVVAGNKNEPMTDLRASLELVTDDSQDSLYVQDYFKRLL
ncbi:MAG: hypothetical protein M3P08_01560 [Thermoproteota archaeon]|jgi:hypothetical protein|nr:hypothetical protein [Thermoproteota archaeon]